MFDFVQRLLFSIESFNTADIECITNAVWLNGHIQRGVTCHWRTKINLKQPRLKIWVYKNIKSHDLKAVRSMCSIFFHSVLNVIFTAHNSLNNYIVTSWPEQVHIDTNLFKMPAESSKRPFVSEVILLAVLILNELFILFIYWVVCQVHVLVILVDFGRVSLRSESG